MPLASTFALQWHGPGLGAAFDVCVPTASATIKAKGRLAAVHTTAPTAYARPNDGRQLRAVHTTAPTAYARISGRGRMAAVGRVNELTQDDVTGAVWQAEVEPGKSYQDAILELLAGGGGGGGGLTVSQDARLTRIEKILRNKLITDPATGTMRLYDDDGTTLLLEADVFQDAAGTQPYQGQGAERRERLA